MWVRVVEMVLSSIWRKETEKDDEQCADTHIYMMIPCVRVVYGEIQCYKSNGCYPIHPTNESGKKLSNSLVRVTKFTNDKR